MHVKYFFNTVFFNYINVNYISFWHLNVFICYWKSGKCSSVSVSQQQLVESISALPYEGRWSYWAAMFPNSLASSCRIAVTDVASNVMVTKSKIEMPPRSEFTSVIDSDFICVSQQNTDEMRTNLKTVNPQTHSQPLRPLRRDANLFKWK